MQRSVADDFSRFQSQFALQKVHLPRHDVEWCYFQGGSSSGNSSGSRGSLSKSSSAGGGGSAAQNTIVFLHGTSGVAAAFFYQVAALTTKGYRVISAQYPAYYSVEEWCRGFDHFLDAMKCRSVHLFGAGVGGFLGQCFACTFPNRVQSLILCNAFATTHPFAAKAGALATVVHITPTPLLRKVMLDSFPQAGMMLEEKQAIDWVAQQVNDLSGDDLAARLTLNCTAESVGELRMEQGRITLLESNGDTMVPEEVRRDLRHRYPSARLAELKATGDFPYLAWPEEVTLFVEVHLRKMGACGNNAASLEAPSSELAEAADRLTTPAETPEWEPSRTVWEDEYKDGRPQPMGVPTGPRTKWQNPFEDDPLL